MNWLRGFLRATALIALTLACLPLQAIGVRLNMAYAATLPGQYHRWALKIMGITCTEHGLEHRSQASGLILANHTSWLDILIISSLRPVVFIAKSEVETWPMFGLLARLQRTLFVNRTRRSQTMQISQQISQTIGQGTTVVLFAEGTTSDGNRLLPFKSALIGAIEAQSEAEKGASPAHTLQPLALYYSCWGGVPLSRAYRPRISWYGDMEILPHLWALLKGPGLTAEVTWCEPLQSAQTLSRKELTAIAETRVRTALRKKAV